MCGVAAWMGEGAAGAVYELLLELQHRGQEAAGVAFLAGGRIGLAGGGGLVEEAVKLPPEASRAWAAIGHVRYSTSSLYGGELFQPVAGARGLVYVAFNGNIVNYRELGGELLGRRYSWDAQLVADLVEALYLEHGSLADALREAARLLRGAYSMVALSSRGELAAARDPYGVRPLAYALGDGYAAVASETAALDTMGLAWRELPAGGLLYCNGSPKDCVETRLAPSHEPRPCAFEYVYFLRPDSVFEGVEAHAARVEMGRRLARSDTVEADLVAPVPDSGRSAAIGYALERGIPLVEVLYRNRYAGRAFIAPPRERDGRLRRKFNPIRSAAWGKRIILIDDSVVRGSTGRRIAATLRAAGAREVHLRVASPPVVMPCFLGIDMPSRRELVAHGRSVDEVARLLGVDSLLYLGLRGLEEAVGRRLCLGCFGGSYPFPLDVERLEKVFTEGRR
ncbi:hypothetical protein CF15_04895 [Pyrodictium occultum]|uniref:Amidophosphoribosyltransferase n=1 Tax=Pyrodictium occultum TaxID=2309 RepID=A0A0V8RVP2_PYROC|nr:hypothetical protein CF15_04895 [Pyrodictium occultum]